MMAGERRRDFIRYVRRDLKIGRMEPDDSLAWAAPVGLGTNVIHRGPARPREGDRIWLVSWLRLDGVDFPPSLDALVVVTETDALFPDGVARLLGKGGKKEAYPAGKGSRWLPLMDAMPLLEELRDHAGRPVLAVRENKHGVRMSPGQRASQGMRSLRRLSEEAGKRLRQWVEESLEAPVFLSYRRDDGDPIALALVQALLRTRVAVWWDRWSISIRLDDLDWDRAEEELMGGLQDAMADCALILRVKTRGYGRSKWTKRELKWCDPRKLWPWEEPSEDRGAIEGVAEAVARWVRGDR